MRTIATADRNNTTRLQVGEIARKMNITISTNISISTNRMDMSYVRYGCSVKRKKRTFFSARGWGGRAGFSSLLAPRSGEILGFGLRK